MLVFAGMIGIGAKIAKLEARVLVYIITPAGSFS